MPEVNTLVKTVDAGEKKEITAEEMVAKIENPVSIKDFYVNNLYAAADRIVQNYNGTDEQRIELLDLLRSQAYYSKTNNGFAFFTEFSSSAFEVNLLNRDVESLKSNRSLLLKEMLPDVHNFPRDPKIASEFTAIVTSSLDDAIRAKMQQLSIRDTSKEAKSPVEVENTTSANVNETDVVRSN